jgi:hypothetical protein
MILVKRMILDGGKGIRMSLKRGAWIRYKGWRRRGEISEGRRVDQRLGIREKGWGLVTR